MAGLIDGGKMNGKIKQNLVGLLVTVCAIPAFGISAAHAQEAAPVVTLEGIVVTATKTGAQQVQSTPVAVTVFGSDMLEKQGLTNIRDIAPYIPNVTLSQNTAAAIIYIRGIGSNNVGPGSDPDVTSQIDGIYVARPSGQMSDFLDVERIEVLRGPQGTLYGRNAVGGTINVISRQPLAVFAGEIRETLSNYGGTQTDAYVTGPISETMQGSVAVNLREHRPFFENIAPNGHNVGDARRGGVRAQLRWEPTSAIDATIRADYSKVDNEHYESYDHLSGKLPFSAPLANSLTGNLRQVAIDADQTITQENSGVSVDINWRIGNGLTLKSLTGWRETKFHLINDNDASEVFVTRLSSADRDRQFSQEFNLQYVTAGLRAVAGVYYFADTDMLVQSATSPPSVFTPPPASGLITATPTIKSKSGAVFAQAVYEVVPKLNLTLGVRYTDEKKTMDQFFTRTSQNPPTFGVTTPGFPIVFNASRTDHAFTPKVGLDFKLNDNALLYASATKGFKSGGFNFAGRSATTAQFAPETIWSYESGLKSEWLDRRLRLNLTGFYYDYKDLQVQQLLGPGNVAITNAATAKVKGLELEVVAKATRELQFSGNISALDAKYDRFPAAPIPGGFAQFFPGKTTVDASHNYLTGAPKLSGFAAADYSQPWDNYRFDAHVDYAWRSRTYFDPSNIPQSSQDAYGLVNAYLGFSPSAKDIWRLELFGKNLTDRKYFQVIAGNGFTPGGIVGDPRTYGIRAVLKF